ncbi:unnamed protein product [Symbiodinium sp. CCMP2456]|nr:unnamed protein product [Symbiodinium sp. CCMP2456]
MDVLGGDAGGDGDGDGGNSCLAGFSRKRPEGVRPENLFVSRIQKRSCTEGLWQHREKVCIYPPEQFILAVAKSTDARHGFLLLTRSGEIGTFTPKRGLVTTPFPWRDLDPMRWHRLLAVGSGNSTAFFCNGEHIGAVPSVPERWQWPARFGGDADARKPQGAGELRNVMFCTLRPSAAPRECRASEETENVRYQANTSQAHTSCLTRLNLHAFYGKLQFAYASLGPRPQSREAAADDPLIIPLRAISCQAGTAGTLSEILVTCRTQTVREGLQEVSWVTTGI